jgi:hypothetical protein
MSPGEKKFTELATKQLLGRKIAAVRYMTKKEADDLGWTSRPVVLQLDDGNLIFPSQDDEGNGPGSLFTNNQENGTIPAIR